MSEIIHTCHYHRGIFAENKCEKCGFYICSQCEVSIGKGRYVCVSCQNKEYKEEHKEHRNWIKHRNGRFVEWEDFIEPSIYGVLLVLGAILFVYFGKINLSFATGVEGIISSISFLYVVFSTPFGYIFLDELFADKVGTLYESFSRWYFKAAFGFLFGWVFFSIYWIKFAKIREKEKKEEKRRKIDNL